ncbi:MAG: hypothetical protein COY69_02665 [Candidatus Magasanikbacteria bacterium CG_4_10_14_0_8_um_filter_32_14]|uniref:Peptidase M16 n=1 Tax=Candidatus Magasanikbacteria bacterium CG_4_10_14_0_8_um_filter_32_14 TaxID=1974640 RepID=A0A2M7R910_9BACT|nr:MAG: hypothetical protein COY69_02665 [Candidatus Magasanikbacteria bacterium CG_4_10_14_0_8_um_filter_32_14]
MYEYLELKNKAKVYFVPLQDTKSLTTLVMYPVGSRFEADKMAGVSHYVEHLMFKGTKKRPNTLVLTREIDRLGAHYNAFTGKEYTGYYIKADAKYSEVSMDILSDMLFNSKFDEKEMEREKGPIIEEIRMYKDNPLMNIDNIFEDLMFGGCPLGRDIAGTEVHVRSYKRPDVIKYRDTYYSPDNMTIVVAGAIDEKIKKEVEKYFGAGKNSGAKKRDYKPACFGHAEKNKRITVEKKETDQVQIMLGFPGLNHEDNRNYAESVMNTILGGSMSSRLFIQIRERRGLAYMIRSGAGNFRDTGYFYVRAGLEAKNINKAIGVIKKEIEKICEKGVSKKELEDAKTHIRGSQTLSLEDSASQADYYAEEALFSKKIETPEERLQKIEKVTNEDIIKLAKQIFKWNQMRVAIIGNVEKGDVKF